METVVVDKSSCAHAVKLILCVHRRCVCRLQNAGSSPAMSTAATNWSKKRRAPATPLRMSRRKRRVTADAEQILPSTMSTDMDLSDPSEASESGSDTELEQDGDMETEIKSGSSMISARDRLGSDPIKPSRKRTASRGLEDELSPERKR